MKKVSILVILLTLLLTACTVPMVTDAEMDGGDTSADEAAATAEPAEESAADEAEAPTEDAASRPSRLTGAASEDSAMDADIAAAHMATLPAASEAGGAARQPRLTGAAPSAQATNLPLAAGQTIARGQRYYSPSGDHYLIFQDDGNLVVYTSDDGFVWGIQELADKYAEAETVKTGTDGNLVVTGANDSYIWSALTENGDARAYLDLTPNGALQLVSDRRGVLWSSDGDLSAIDHGTECAPYNGWAHCQMLADPKIKIIGSKNVSQSAMDVVAGIYTDMTALFSEEYPEDKFDGYVIYITNGEPWPELSGLHPVGTMWPAQEGTSSGDFLRGGTTPNYLWISEQMICKTGVATRENDTAERTFDQVIHEFGHAIDMNYGLRERIDRDYPANENFPPAEQFAASNQFWFGAPIRDLSDTGRAFMEEIFTGQKTFSCDTYESDGGSSEEPAQAGPSVMLTFTQIDDEVEVFLNGESVFQNAILRHNEPQIEVDLSDQLVSGTNVMKVEATNGPGSATLLGLISVDGEVIDEWDVLTQSNVKNPFVDETYEVER